MEKQGVKSNHSSRVANAGVVAAAEYAVDQGTGNTAVHNQSPVPARPFWEDTSSSTEASSSGMQDIGSRLHERVLFFSSTDAASLMLNSWRPITQKVYDTYIRKWERYAGGLCKYVIS